jgi:hypothetical protein
MKATTKENELMDRENDREGKEGREYGRKK